MVIFGGARSCGLPAARGLRPQAPAVLPRLCQQGAGSRGCRRPSGRAHVDPAGSMGLGQARGPALPEENRADVAARAISPERLCQPPRSSAQRRAWGAASVQVAVNLARPRAPEGGRRGTKRLASVPEGPGSGISVPRRRGLKPLRPKARRLASKSDLPARPPHAACPEPPRAPSPERRSGAEARRASPLGGRRGSARSPRPHARALRSGSHPLRAVPWL